MRIIKPFTIAVVTSATIACGGGSSNPGGTGPVTDSGDQEHPSTSTTSSEFLLFIDKINPSSSFKDIYQVDPLLSTISPRKLNQSEFSIHESHPALPTSAESWVHSMVWVEGQTIWGTDSATADRYELVSSLVINNLCKMQYKTPMRDGSMNLLLIRDKGEDGTCSSDDDNYFTMPYNSSSPSTLNPVAGEIINGLDGGIILNNVSDITHTYFTDSDGNVAIFDQSTMQVVARYDVSSNIQWGPTLNDSIFIIINNEIFYGPFESLVDGSFDFSGGHSLNSNAIDMYVANDKLFISSATELQQYDPSSNTISTVATLAFNSSTILSVSGDFAYLLDRSSAGATVYQVQLSNGEVSTLIESTDPKLVAIVKEDKIWAYDQDSASIYDTNTGQSETVEDSTFTFIGLSESTEVVLTKSRTFNGINTENGYISKYDPQSGSQTMNYGEYEVPNIYLGWHGSRYRLGVDHDYYKLFLIDFEKENSLKEVWESNGVISLPF